MRHPDYVMEMPKSRERIRGRDAMRGMQETSLTPATLRLRRVLGSGRVWVVEGVNDYDGDVWQVVVILELDDDRRIVRDTRYCSQALEPPAGVPDGWSRSNECPSGAYAERSNHSDPQPAHPPYSGLRATLGHLSRTENG